MGNVSDKAETGKHIYVNSLIRKVLSDNKNTKDENFEYVNLIKSETNNKINLNLRNKRIIDSSLMMAEEIIKSSLVQEFNSNSYIYSALLVFKDIDKVDNYYNLMPLQDKNEKKTKVEDEELSNINQIKSAKNLLFPKVGKNKNLAKVLSLFTASEVQIDNKIKINFVSKNSPVVINKSKSKTTNEVNESAKRELENKIGNVSRIQSSNSNNKESKTFSNDLSSLRHPSHKDRSFEDISLQEYLKMETERLKKDPNYLNYKHVKESCYDTEVVNTESTEKQILQSLKCEEDHNDRNLLIMHSTKKNNQNLNLMKNKHLDKLKVSQSNGEYFSHTQTGTNKRTNWLGSKQQVSLSENKNKKHFKSNKHSFVPSDSNLNSNFGRNISKSKFVNFNKKDEEISARNFESFSHRSQRIHNVKSIDNYKNKYNNGKIKSTNNNGTTKNTSRAPSNRDRNKLIISNNNSLKNKSYDENPTKINLSTSKNKNSSSRTLTIVSSQRQVNQNNQTNNLKPPLASIKIDIRDLMIENPELNSGNTLKNSEDNVPAEINEYVKKFNQTNKKYSDIFSVEKEDVDINDLIIDKQKVDKNGLLLNN